MRGQGSRRSRVAGGIGVLLVGASVALLAGVSVAGKVSSAVTSNVGSAVAGLLAAGRAADAGRPQEAASGYADVERAHPLIADHAALLGAELLLADGQPDAALAAARRGLRAVPATPLRPRLHQIEAQAFHAQGKVRAERAAIQEARLASDDYELRGELVLELGISLEGEGRLREAGNLYRKIWREVHSLDQASRAEARLVALEPRLGGPLRTGGDWRRHGDGLLRLQYSGEALAAYDEALSRKLSAADRRRAEGKRAQCLFSLRRYPEAMKGFAALTKSDPEARIWHARARARAGDVPGAVSELEVIAARGPSRLRGRARYLAALLLEDDDPAAARKHFERLAREGPTSQRTSALWKLGWGDYREGRLDEAQRYFERLARLEEHPIDRLRARYWSARARETSHPLEARRALAELAAQYPLSYYGWRAAGRVTASGAPATTVSAPRAATARRTLPPDGEAGLRPAALERPRILVGAGLNDAARTELAHLEEQASGRGERVKIATLYGEAGDHNAAQRTVLIAMGDELPRGPIPGHEEAWWLAWPLAWDESVQRWTAAAAVEPALVWAIMREESGYRPAVVSMAGARGLLQIMPETGERLAADAGLPDFQPEDLFQPEVNIRLATNYLDQLGRRFQGRRSAAIGSYNAGPEAVARWLDERPDLQDDEWVEAVPYRETRRYLKRVLRSTHAYRVLY